MARSLGAACLQADAGQGSARARGISDAEVAVLQGESGSRERLRASVKSLCICATAEGRWPLLFHDAMCDAHSECAGSHPAASRPKVGASNDPQPPAAMRAGREINRARSHRERNADCDAISQTPSAGAPSRSWVPWVGGRRLRGVLCPAHERGPAPGCDACGQVWRGAAETTLLRCLAFGARIPW